MKKTLLTAVIASAMSFSALAGDVAKNTTIATEALTKVFDQLDSSLIDTYYADDYIQHTPSIEDSKAGLKSDIDGMKGNVTVKRDIARVIAEGDLVFVQSRVSFNDSETMVVADLFCVKDGKIAEHWDRMQPEVPKVEAFKHKNGIF